jgi:hypothetical protein
MDTWKPTFLRMVVRVEAITETPLQTLTVRARAVGIIGFAYSCAGSLDILLVFHNGFVWWCRGNNYGASSDKVSAKILS